MTRNRLVLGAVLALALGACSQPRADLAAQGRSERTVENGKARTAAAASRATTTRTTARTAAQTSKRKDAGQPAALPSGPASHNTMPLRVTINRTCARVGDRMEATAVTLPRAQIAFATAYSDNTLVPDFTYVPKDANTTGTFTWRWVIRPEIPPGEALLTVVVSKAPKGASYDLPFRIARAC